jgi:hypothetical protein
MILAFYINKILAPKETFSSDENERDGIKSLYLYMIGYNAKFYYNFTVVDYIILAVIYFVTFFISVFAAYLSFTCTWNGIITNIYLRIFSAIFAFMLGPIYIIWYFFVNYLGNICTIK